MGDQNTAVSSNKVFLMTNKMPMEASTRLSFPRQFERIQARTRRVVACDTTEGEGAIGRSSDGECNNGKQKRWAEGENGRRSDAEKE